MTMMLFASLLLAQAPALPESGLKLKAELTWGDFGPPRTPARYVPRDWLIVSLRAEGLTLDKLGNINAVVRTEVRGQGGAVKSMKRQETGTISGWQGQTLRGAHRCALDPDLAPGAYVLSVSLLDRHSGQEAAVELPFEVGPKDFALLGPLFSTDAQGALSCGPQGLCRQTLFVKVGVIGHTLVHGNSRALAVLEVIGLDGQVLYEQRSAPLELASPLLSFDCPLTLMRPGDFKLRLTVTDEHAKATRSIEVPLRVREP